MFDTKRFLDDYNIEYWTHGKNVADGFINISCPHCADSSNHGGFSLDGSIFLCWRCGSHNVFETLSLLTGINLKELYKIVKDYNLIIDFEEEKIEYNNTTIEMKGDKLLPQHKKYLESRNFNADYLERKYDLKGTLFDKDYGYRIMIPVYYNNRIVSYQGRDFTGKSPVRYMMCKPENEIIPIKNILYNLDNCKNRWCIVVEGIFDVWRLGDNCCSTLGTSYKKEQLNLLAKRFDIVFTMFDGEPQAQIKARKLGEELTLLGKEVINLKLESGDPAELTDEEGKEIIEDVKCYIK